MAMERFTISMNEKDIDLFERYRTEVGMNKSAFIRLLLSEHENNIPEFVQHKDLIREFSEFNTSVKEMILSDKFTDSDKLEVLEKLQTITNLMKNIFPKTPDN